MTEFACAKCGSANAASAAQRLMDRNVRGPVSTDLCAKCTGVRFWNGVRGMVAILGLGMAIAVILEEQYLGLVAVAGIIGAIWWFSGRRLADWQDE
jgi:hypothetical protein